MVDLIWMIFIFELLVQIRRMLSMFFFHFIIFVSREDTEDTVMSTKAYSTLKLELRKMSYSLI